MVLLIKINYNFFRSSTSIIVTFKSFIIFNRSVGGGLKQSVCVCVCLSVSS